jgi:hypothetical protein
MQVSAHAAHDMRTSSHDMPSALTDLLFDVIDCSSTQLPCSLQRQEVELTAATHGDWSPPPLGRTLSQIKSQNNFIYCVSAVCLHQKCVSCVYK